MCGYICRTNPYKQNCRSKVVSIWKLKVIVKWPSVDKASVYIFINSLLVSSQPCPQSMLSNFLFFFNPIGKKTVCQCGINFLSFYCKLVHLFICSGAISLSFFGKLSPWIFFHLFFWVWGTFKIKFQQFLLSEGNYLQTLFPPFCHLSFGFVSGGFPMRALLFFLISYSQICQFYKLDLLWLLGFMSYFLTPKNIKNLLKM